VHQWHLLLLLVVGQASHNLTSFLAALLIIDIQAAPMPRGPEDFFFWEGPSYARHFLAAILITRGSRASTLAGQSSVGMS
jgi:hypothetical protein